MAAEHALLIGARIAEARRDAGMSQRELADKIPGKSDGTQVSKWERGEHRVSDDTLAHIARILKREVCWFHASAPDKTATPDLSRNGSQFDRIENQLAKNAEAISQLQTDLAQSRAETMIRAAEVLARIDEEAEAIRQLLPPRRQAKPA